MVKVEFGLLRYLEEEDFRVLVALEMCMRNHDVAPTVLIERIAQLPHGGARKRLNNLLKFKVIHHESLCYDGFCMKYAAYDFLALRTFVKRGTLSGIGTRIGCGKESDIMTVISPDGHESVMKLQRLGRCSFRSVARNRDYKGNGKQRRGESWFYLSRLAATKEFAFMKMLYDEGFPVPKPIDHNRHAVVMERVNGTLLNHIADMSGHAQKVYERILNLMVKLAQHGLIHGDFNEFNTFVTDEFKIVIIDFPQMVSTDHPNASELFDRDVNNLAAFFTRRHKIEKVYFPKLEADVERTERFDQRLAASGAFTKNQQKELEMMMQKAEAEEENAEEEEEEEEEEEAVPELAPVEEEGSKATTSLVPASDAQGSGKAKHADPTAQPSTGALTIAALAARTSDAKAPSAAAADDDAASNVSSNGPAPAGAGADDRHETRSVAPSIASTAATLAKRILAKQRADNANFQGDSTEIDKEHVWKRTKARAQHNQNVQFNQQMHRNTQKGKQKRRVQREIDAGDHPLTIYGS